LPAFWLVRVPVSGFLSLFVPLIRISDPHGSAGIRCTQLRMICESA
jgi:hypothetical protein